MFHKFFYYVKQMEDYVAFNKAFKNFIRCSIDAFPDMKELRIVLITYKMLKTISTKQPCKLFSTMTAACQDAIFMKDEKYFMQNGVRCPEATLNSLSPAIQHKWMSLDDDNKETIWQHLQVLVALSKKCT